jgi:hypothetical protein
LISCGLILFAVYSPGDKKNFLVPVEQVFNLKRLAKIEYKKNQSLKDQLEIPTPSELEVHDGRGYIVITVTAVRPVTGGITINRKGYDGKPTNEQKDELDITMAPVKYCYGKPAISE